MVKTVDVATVRLWGKDIGAVIWDQERELGSFEFEPSFLRKNINLSPYLISLEKPGIISYPNLDKDTYKGLPGLLSDSLPDDFGNAVIDAWLARMGRTGKNFSPVERLCYTGTRGMGALEFHPAVARKTGKSGSIEIQELVQLASRVLNNRESFITKTGETDEEKRRALSEIISVGTSAGGQRPKALIAINPGTGKIVSGQVQAPKGYEYWLLKFDGVSGRSLNGVIADPGGYGKIEYAYYLMARECGIDIMESRLYKENGRSHFMTKRFDRTSSDEKVHMLSLCGMAHFDYKKAGYYSYEQLFQVMRELRLPHSQAVQMYRRMIFNIIARNQDDHTKNIAFTMDKKGKWELSPAFD
ncbi:MAG: type II toxin-antitoxin system HipA family toxin, partial [Spirochaetota bacterium]|nr:type II toxin-antitoxin system HipA family toxin [Spirochaetota bacterium]